MMKRMSVVMIALLSSMSFAVMVENFDSYSLGAIDETGSLTGGVWVESPVHPTATVNIAIDPSNAGNQVIGVRNNSDTVASGQVGVYGVLSGGSIVGASETKTLFTKVYTSQTASDISFGFCASDVPTSWSQMNAYFSLVGSNTSGQAEFRARNAGANTKIGNFTANTWMYVWLVVDNAANTYDVYMNTTGADATATDLLADNFVFRTGAADGDLDRLFIMCNNGSFGGVPYNTTTTYYDNIAISDGVDLTIPEPATMLILGLGGLTLLRKR